MDEGYARSIRSRSETFLTRRNRKLQEKMRHFAAELHTCLVGGKRIDTSKPLQAMAGSV